jgi:predicted protein tyrosine phosphatase
MITKYTTNADVLGIMSTIHNSDLHTAFKSYYCDEQCSDIYDFYNFLDTALNEGHITQLTYNDVIKRDNEIFAGGITWVLK